MRYYSSSAGAMTLTSDITAGTTIIGVSSVAGLPTSFPYTIVLDVGQAAEEICTVTSSSGAALTVTRGQDGTSAQSHSLGAVVRHMLTARDLREPQEHINAAAGVHGVTGAVVGTTDAQTLTNKTLSAPAITGAATAQQVTLQPSSDAGVAIKTTGRFTQTGNLQEWVNGASLLTVAKVNANGYFTGEATNLIIRGDYGDTPAVDIPSEGSGGRTVPQVRVNTRADDTADILSLQKNGVEVAKFDKDGNLTSPTITNLNTADTNLGNRVTAIETNLGSQTTFVASSAAKDGKRIHWETKSAGPTDASGYFTVTHNAGFTPTSVLASNSDGYQMGIDQYTATTFRMRLLTAAGAVFNAASTTITYMCGE